MSIQEAPNGTERPLAHDVLNAARYYLGGRRGLIVLGAVVLIGGVALNWGWLIAAGIAPLLLTALPCVAMCALGLCANKMMGRSGNEAQTTEGVRGNEPTAVAPPLTRESGPALLAAADQPAGTVGLKNLSAADQPVGTAGPDNLPAAAQPVNTASSKQKHGCC